MELASEENPARPQRSQDGTPGDDVNTIERDSAELGTDGDSTSDAEQKRAFHHVLRTSARRGVRNAAAFLSVGLVLEVLATGWTLAQAVSVGVFTEDCGRSSLALYSNQLIQKNCTEVDFSDTFFNDVYDANIYTSCSSLEDPPTKPVVCDCDYLNCNWTAAKTDDEELAGLCLAYARFGDSDISNYGYCTSQFPEGFAEIIIAAVVVGLGVELVEALVGYNYLRNPLAGTRLMAAGTVVEATGILTLLWLGKDLTEGPLSDNQISNKQQKFLIRFIYSIIAVTCVGTLSEVSFCCSRTAADRLPYLVAFGNGLIWLSSGMIEVLMILFLAVRQGNDDRTWQFVEEALVGLVVLEVAALMAVWTSRVLLTRAKSILLRIKDMNLQELFGGFTGPQELPGPVCLLPRQQPA